MKWFVTAIVTLLITVGAVWFFFGDRQAAYLRRMKDLRGQLDAAVDGERQSLIIAELTYYRARLVENGCLQRETITVRPTVEGSEFYEGFHEALLRHEKVRVAECAAVCFVPNVVYPTECIPRITSVTVWDRPDAIAEWKKAIKRAAKDTMDPAAP